RSFMDRLELSGGGVVVAVSGGPDSVALLRALVAWRGNSPQPRLEIAHLNHQLRGQESDADAEFVRQLHTDLVAAGVPELALHCETGDGAALATAEKDKREAIARRERYDWLRQVAERTGARWVATGHTADDQAETVLHHLLRGTGLQGLRGIA